jgi:hypothetical protein
MYNMVIYYYVLIVFSFRRESIKLILAMDPFRGGSVTKCLSLHEPANFEKCASGPGRHVLFSQNSILCTE